MADAGFDFALAIGIADATWERDHAIVHQHVAVERVERRVVDVRPEDTLAPDLAGGLGQLCRLLADVRDIDLPSRHFGQVQVHRNNQFYDFLLKVCELIFRHLLPTEERGASQFRDFLRDERQMRILFENFVRNFYRIETAYRVKREDIYWRWIAAEGARTGSGPDLPFAART